MTKRRPSRVAPLSKAKSGHKTQPKRPAAAAPIDAYIDAAARLLDLPIDKAWRPAIRANLQVTLRHAANVTQFKLPDDAEPAAVFKA